MSDLRVLYSSNAFWAKSGYGIQGKSLLPRLANLTTVNGRQNIAQFAWYGSQGGIHNVEGFMVYPTGADPYGNDIIESHTKHFGANIVITLIDAWVLENTAKKVAPALWCPWLPVDHDPVPEKVLYALDGAYMPLSYSQHGHEALNKQSVKNLYIPHGIETTEFKVLPYEVVQRFKEQALHFNGHLTSMVAANKGYPDRKAFQVQLRAWADFAKNKPDAKLYLHTEPTPLYGGLDLNKLCAVLGITDKVMFPSRYENFMGFPTEFMALIYNSSDILMAASMGEGFGIPIIEAQACGTPVITTNWTSMPELIHYGTITEPLDLVWTQQNSFWAWPDHQQITEALEENYQQWQEQGKDEVIGKQVQDTIHDIYSWDSLVEKYWKPFFEQAHSSLFPRTLNSTPKTGKVLPHVS